MYNDYYALPSTSDGNYLVHYGVKGMKWGIRKRPNSAGTARRHSSGFKRVQAKLAQFSKENREINKVQKAQAKGKNRKVRKAYEKAASKLEELNLQANRDYQRGQNDQMKEDQSRMFWWSDSAGSFGSSPRANTLVRVMNRMDGRKSKKLISDKGHTNAVKARNDYAKHMAKMFAGTQYARQTSAAARKRIRVQK